MALLFSMILKKYHPPPPLQPKKKEKKKENIPKWVVRVGQRKDAYTGSS